MPIQGSHQHERTGVALRLNELSQEQRQKKKPQKTQVFLIHTKHAMWTTPSMGASEAPILGTHDVV